MYSLASCQVDGSASPYVRWRSRHPTKHGAWHNALISGLVLVVTHVFKVKSPAFRHLLWLAVLLKPIVAIAVSSPLSLFTPLTWSDDTSVFVISSVPLSLSESQEHVAPVGATSEAPDLDLSLAGVVAALWLLGAALLTCRIVVGCTVIWRLRRQSLDERSGPLFSALQAASTAIGISPSVDIASSSSVRSPIVIGIFKPLILVPVDLVDRLTGDELKMILMHELAHVRRLDNLTLLIQRLVEAALFFHPAVWLCGRMLHREAEQACDDLVMDATGRSEQYARGLSGVAELSHLKRRLPAMGVFAAAESDLALRIRRALDASVYRMGIRSRFFAGGILLGIGMLTLPSAAENQPVVVKAPSPPPKVATLGPAAKSSSMDTIMVTTNDSTGATTLIFNSKHLRKITANPAETNGERFVLASFMLVMTGETITQEGDGMTLRAAAELTIEEGVSVQERLEPHGPLMQSIALHELRTRTVEQLDVENTKSLTSAVTARINHEVFVPYIAKMLPGKQLTLKETIITQFIIQ